MTERIDWREEIEKESYFSNESNMGYRVVRLLDIQNLIKRLELQHSAEIAELKEKSKAEAVRVLTEENAVFLDFGNTIVNIDEISGNVSGIISRSNIHKWKEERIEEFKAEQNKSKKQDGK